MPVPNSVPAAYRLKVEDNGEPWRDPEGRVRYLYVTTKAAPTPTEGTTDA